LSNVSQKELLKAMKTLPRRRRRIRKRGIIRMMRKNPHKYQPQNSLSHLFQNQLFSMI